MPLSRILLLLIIPSWLSTQAQTLLCPSGKEGNYWFFGDSVGLNFNTHPPTVLTGIPMSTYEASAIVSDADGNLLFYSNGEYVWDKNHQLMPAVNPAMGGNKLKGSESATHILAIPLPSNTNVYYLFYPETFDLVINTPADTLRKMYYSVIDMTLNGGLGDISDKDHLLFEKTTEKVAATRHCNGEDWWVVTAESGSNRYLIWSLTNTGLSSSPLVSSIGAINRSHGAGKGGVLKFSPDATKLLKIGAARITLNQPWTLDCYVELLSFDNATGAIYNPILVLDSVRRIYGGEFSPDNTKLYFNYWTPIKDSLYQYDLCVYHPDSIRSSRTPIDLAASNTGQLQIGPDGKIYLSSTFRDFISIIHKPNEKGIACQYEKQAITFPSGESLLGIPTFPASYYAPGKPYLTTTGSRCAPLCRDSVQQYYVTGSCVSGAQYEWSATDGTVVQQAQDTAWVRWQQAGVQEVRVRKVWACGDRSDTLRVEVKSCGPCVPVEVQVAATTCDPALAGVDTVQLMTVQGCDSLVVTTTTLLPSIQTVLSATTCDPALAGVDTLHLSTTYGCDSLVITTTTLLPSVQMELNATTCDPALAGVDTLHLMTAQGCDSIVITTTTLLSFAHTLLNTTTCDPALAGVDTLHIMTVQGCDSLVITTTTWLPSMQTELSSTTCDPAMAGVDTVHLMTTYGCDSLVIMTITLLPSVQTILSATTCDPALVGVDTLHLSTTYGCDSLVITTTTLLPSVQMELNATTCDPALAGVDTLHLMTVQGCDSLVITTTTLLPSVQTMLSATTCDPALAGVDTLHLLTMQGCDSLVITTTTLLPSVQTELSATTCDPALAGVDTLHLMTMQGCDSLVITTTILLPSFQTELSATTCDPALAGVDTLHLMTVQGCDSLVITTTTLLPSVQTELSLTTCDPALAGVDTVHLVTAQGCDSLVITTTALLPSVQTVLSATTCDPSLAGVDTSHLMTAQGCDSLVITTTTLLPSVQTMLTATTCDPALAGVDTLHLMTAQGCDSLVITTTTLLPSVQTVLSATTCDPALAGVDTLYLMTVQGCDSLVITTTTLLQSVQTILSATTCDPALAGVDTLHLMTVQGCDSLVITTKTLLPSVQTELSLTTCDPALAGVDTLHLVTTQGCDSLIITTTLFAPSFLRFLNETTCDSALVGTDTLRLTTVQGCDSIVVTTTSLLPVVEQSQEIGVCPGTTYTFAGSVLQAGEERSFMLHTTKGCDSLVHIRVFAWPESVFAVETTPSCPNRPSGTAALSALSGGLPPFEWSVDSGDYVSGLFADDLAAGDHTIRLRDARGCLSDTTIAVGQLPALSVSLPAATLPCDPGSEVMLSLLAQGLTEQLEYQWNTGANTASIAVSASGLYRVTVSNVCQAEQAETVVTQEDERTGDPMYVPNVFAPESGTEDNRQFRPFLREDILLTTYRLRVFDRWGSLLFETIDPQASWDGTVSGRYPAPGIFVWLLEAEWEQCGRILHWQRQGDVLLVR